MQRFLPFTASLLVAGSIVTGLAAQESPFTAPHALPEDRQTGGRSVTVEQCKEWLYTLASPEYEGRQTGHPGFEKAAEYVSAHFRDLGLVALSDDGSYYQHVPWSRSDVDEKKTYVSFVSGTDEILRIPADRLSGSVTAPLSASGEVVLLVLTPEAQPADEQGGRQRRFRMPKIDGLDELDLTDKVVVAYIRNTGDRGAQAMMSFALRRAMSGKDAAAVLYATADAPATSLRGASSSRRTTNPAAAGRRRRPTTATFGGEDFERMLDADDLDLAQLDGSVLAPPMTLKAEVEIHTKEAQAPAMNVFGVLPGSDPELRDEYVVIGSHLDHVGMRGGLHPGADDDASGTTGVMAVAQMFVKNEIKPRRSILFVCFAGEEDGLVGSRFFANNPPIPLESIAAELQMDMIGRDEEANRESRTPEERSEKAEDNRDSLHLIGTQKLAPALHALCLQKNESAGFAIEYDQEGMFGRSDHANFARKGVPIAFFFTGLHADYHETTDTPDKIHFEKLLRVASYVYDIAFDLAQSDTRPLIDPELWQNMRNRGSKDPAAPLMDK